LRAIAVARIHFGLHDSSDAMAGATTGAGLMLLAHRLPTCPSGALARPFGTALARPGAAWALLFLFCIFETLLMFQNLGVSCGSPEG
jgi:hypothetical protein